MNAVLKLSQLGSMIGDIFDGLGNMFTNIFGALFGFIATLLYQVLIVPLFMIIDGIQLIFRKMAGLDIYVLDGESRTGDIVLGLIENETVQNIFWSLVILAVVLLFLTTIVALIRSETQLADEKPKTKSQIFARSLKALVNFFMVPVVAILGILLGNALLKSLDQATNGGTETRISGIVFKACASECNRARNSAVFARDLADGKNTMGLTFSSAESESVAIVVDEAFCSFASYDQSRSFSFEPNNWFSDPDGTYIYQLSLTAFSAGTCYIQRNVFSVYDAAQVYYYYNLLDFNFLLSIIACLFIAYVLAVTSLGLVKRLYKLVTLLCVSPVIASLYPLDEGNALKKWRTEFIGSTLSAYSTVVVLNIMLTLIGPLTKLELFPNTVENSVGHAFAGIGLSFLNNIALLLIVCGGFVFFKELSTELGKIIGAENAYAQGGEGAKKMAAIAGTAVAGVKGLQKGLKDKKAAKDARSDVDEAETASAEIKAQYGDRVKALEEKKLKGGLTSREQSELDAKKGKMDDADKKLKEAKEKQDKYKDEARDYFKAARQNFASTATGGLSEAFMKPISGVKDSEVDKNKRKQKNQRDRNRQAYMRNRAIVGALSKKDETSLTNAEIKALTDAKAGISTYETSQKEEKTERRAALKKKMTGLGVGLGIAATGPIGGAVFGAVAGSINKKNQNKNALSSGVYRSRKIGIAGTQGKIDSAEKDLSALQSKLTRTLNKLNNQEAQSQVNEVKERLEKQQKDLEKQIVETKDKISKLQKQLDDFKK